MINKALNTVAPGVVERLNKVPDLERQINALKVQIREYEHELDESRRINLRAAEILDIAYELLLGSADGIVGKTKDELKKQSEDLKNVSQTSQNQSRPAKKIKRP